MVHHVGEKSDAGKFYFGGSFPLQECGDPERSAFAEKLLDALVPTARAANRGHRQGFCRPSRKHSSTLLGPTPTHLPGDSASIVGGTSEVEALA